jgi:N-carbamoylputrescine amidase
MARCTRLGLIQGRDYGSREANLQHTIAAIHAASAAGAQVVVTQELFLTPYFCNVQDPVNFDLAEPVPGPSTEVLSKVAAEAGVVLVASLFERAAAGVYFNTAVVLDADGTLLGCYRKMHIPQDPGFEEKFYFTPGDLGFRVWQTRFGTLGVLICWDQWFPEAARMATLAGAEILIYPTAIGWLATEKGDLGVAQHCAWETVQRGHAVANGCYVAAVNRVGIEGDTEFWGQSFVADPYGQILQRAPVDATVELVVDCDLDALESVRRIWPFLRDRRIDAYSGLSQRLLTQPVFSKNNDC